MTRQPLAKASAFRYHNTMMEKSLPGARSRTKSFGQRIASHLMLVWGRMRAILSDNNQGWLVIVTCLLSLGMSLRMANAAGWIVSVPLVNTPVDGGQAVVASTNAFWRSTLNTGLLAVLLSAASVLTLLGLAEQWTRGTLAGLFLLMFGWYPIAMQSTFQLGVAMSGLYWAGAIGTSAAFYKAYGGRHQQQAARDETDAAMTLIGSLYETWEQSYQEQQAAAARVNP